MKIQSLKLGKAQKEVLDQVEIGKLPLIWCRPRSSFVGLDLAKPGADMSAVSVMKGNGQMSTIIFDEASTWPIYKWYAQPFKWLRWHLLMRRVIKQSRKTGTTWKK